MSRIKSLSVIMRASQTEHFVDLLLQPLAKTSILNSLSLSPVVDYHPIHLDLTSVSTAGTFSSLRYFTATSMLLGWSWPIRNLLSLHLMNLDVAWPKLQDVLAASPELQQLALVNLKIQDYPSLKDNSRGATLPVFHHLWTIRMSNLGYSQEDVHTQPTILHRIRAPAIISLAIDNEYNAWSALSALVLVGKASLENLNVNLMNDPILDDLIAALTDTPALRLKTLTFSHRFYDINNPYHDTISDASMLALAKCTSLQGLKLCDVSFSEESLYAMVKKRMMDSSSGLANFWTSDDIGTAKGELEKLGIVVVDSLKLYDKVWDD
ncbi:hypothetical protein FRB94_007851 [Tulasnella sp. JGI-2019a]|nr:hypothetical protein FRB94_007851 [Tulasnella sp. JGI-2019a]